MKPKNFRSCIRQSIADENLQIALDHNAQRRRDGRLAAFESVTDYQERRQRAHAIKADVVAHLDDYLNQFIARVTANGIIVHRAANADEAIHIFLEIAERHNAHLIAKSKSMLSEEINFNHVLEKHGLRPVETDLGEYIVQLRGERPSHIVTPAVHLRREQVGKLFHEQLGIPYTEDIPTLTNTARKVLREVFLTADIGFSGVNFGVVETGTLCIITNEGNGRMCTTIPPVHVALMGIERLVPSLDDLALFLSLLPRSATGQKLSVYTNLIHSPRRAADPDGPKERRLILLDNGRNALRASPLAEALYCIRCGACLNDCPVFREIGGHAYRGVDGSIAPYPGPIGAILSPGLFGCDNFGHMAQASSLCGACKEACPVDIDLPELLLRVRAGLSPKYPRNEDKKTQLIKQEGIGIPAALRLGLKTFRFTARNSKLFAISQRLGGIISRIYSPRRPHMRLPAWTGWGYSKDFPRFAVLSFRARWKKMSQMIRDDNEQEIERDNGHEMREERNQATGFVIRQSLVAQFINELSALGGQVHVVKKKDLSSRLAEFLKSKNFDRVLVDDVGAEYILSQQAEIALVRELDPTVRVGVTRAQAGIAESGSLMLVAGEGCLLTASLLPEVHVAILETSDILPTLADVLRKPEIRQTAAGVIITGPSRTADIEMALTIGVHGPGELHVFIVEE